MRVGSRTRRLALSIETDGHLWHDGALQFGYWMTIGGGWFACKGKRVFKAGVAGESRGDGFVVVTPCYGSQGIGRTPGLRRLFVCFRCGGPGCRGEVGVWGGGASRVPYIGPQKKTKGNTMGAKIHARWWRGWFGERRGTGHAPWRLRPWKRQDVRWSRARWRNWRRPSAL